MLRHVQGLGADAAQMPVAHYSIVKDFDVIEDISPGQISGFVNAFADAFLLQAAEKGFSDGIVPTISTTLILGSRLLALQKRRRSSLPYWLPWSECTSKGFLGLRRQTAINKASIASMREKIGFIDHPMTLRAKRSTTTVR